MQRERQMEIISDDKDSPASEYSHNRGTHYLRKCGHEREVRIPQNTLKTGLPEKDRQNFKSSNDGEEESAD